MDVAEGLVAQEAEEGVHVHGLQERYNSAQQILANQQKNQNVATKDNRQLIWLMSLQGLRQRTDTILSRTVPLVSKFGLKDMQEQSG